jgi:uncharacterized protein YndB with AHSA1/START domain
MNLAATDTTLEITRIFDAPPERLFDAWLEREEWQAWIGPKGVSCEVPLLEPWVGGRYRVTMRLSDGRVIPVAGVYKTIERPRKLVFTWGWEGDPTRQSLVALSFREVNGKTELTLRHEGLESLASRGDHRNGWNSALDKLVAYVGRTGAV